MKYNRITELFILIGMVTLQMHQQTRMSMNRIGT